MSINEGFGSTLPPVPPILTSRIPTTSEVSDSAAQWAPPPVETGEPSTKDVAKDQAASVAGGAADAAKNVAGTAKEQVGQVATEAKKQVKDLVGQARTELSDQAKVQQERVAGGLHSVADQIRSMAEGASEQGPAVDLAHQAADKAHQIAEFFENRDPGSVLDEVRSFARKQPGVFLALSLGAGVLAGRLARGLSADPEDASASKSTSIGTNSSATAGGLTSGYPARPELAVGTPAWNNGYGQGEEWSSELGAGR